MMNKDKETNNEIDVTEIAEPSSPAPDYFFIEETQQLPFQRRRDSG